MGAIFLNAITIAMETTSLSEKIPLFFTATDNIFLGIYLLEFALKVRVLMIIIILCIQYMQLYSMDSCTNEP